MLQARGLVENLETKKDQIHSKLKQKMKKTERAVKSKRIVKLKNINEADLVQNIRNKRRKLKETETLPLVEEQLQKWSSTAEKELYNPCSTRRRSRRGCVRLY